MRGRKTNKEDYLVENYQQRGGVRKKDSRSWGKNEQGTKIHVCENTIIKLIILYVMPNLN